MITKLVFTLSVLMMVISSASAQDQGPATSPNDDAARLRALIKQMEDDPQVESIDRDEMLSRVQELIKRIKARQPKPNPKSDTTSSGSDFGVADSEKSIGDRTPDDVLVVTQKPKITDTTDAGITNGHEEASGKPMEDFARDGSDCNSPTDGLRPENKDIISAETPADLESRCKALESRCKALEDELVEVNRKLEWLYDQTKPAITKTGK